MSSSSHGADPKEATKQKKSARNTTSLPWVLIDAFVLYKYHAYKREKKCAKPIAAKKKPTLCVPAGPELWPVITPSKDKNPKDKVQGIIISRRFLTEDFN